MRIILTALLSIIILIPHHAGAVTCPATEAGEAACKAVAGCGWDGIACSECLAGTYSTTNSNCQSCPSSHENSAQGSTSKNACYKTCTAKEIQNGTVAPASQNVNYPTDCDYTQKDKVTCEPGYGINPTIGTTLPPDTNNICINGMACSSIHGSILGNCNGTINGDLSWRNNAWNYSTCSCTPSTAEDITKGKGIKTCFYTYGTGSSTTWSTNCTTQTTSCDAGYCGTTACSVVQAGHYSPAGETQCHKCPMGSTSFSGAKAETDCYINGGNATNKNLYTQFCDATGTNCFTLVDDYYYVKP